MKQASALLAFLFAAFFAGSAPAVQGPGEAPPARASSKLHWADVAAVPAGKQTARDGLRQRLRDDLDSVGSAILPSIADLALVEASSINAASWPQRLPLQSARLAYRARAPPLA
ncbi:MAG TPA: hypothetical protein VNT25_04010 [Allosphingosinicella sp.]|jgi:hypothetical protein|nr:hypothetical protein [Allosphingosinicella sp.]